MKDIELIEAYLSDKLTVNEIKVVQERIENEPPFANLVNEYRQTFAVLEKNWLRKNAGLAGQQLMWQKVLKIGIAVIVLSTVLFIAGYKFLKQRHQDKVAVKTEQSISGVSPSRMDSGYNVAIKNSIDSILNKNVNRAANIIQVLSSPVSIPAPPLLEVKKDSFSDFNCASLFKDEFQKFVINPATDNQLKCKGGTVINLPANSLLLPNGKQPTAKVAISVQEYSDYFEMWKHSVSTVSDGHLLQSGGSCFISAECNGEKVALKDGQNYTIAFDSKKDTRMKTFVGERDSIGELNWKPDNVLNRAPVKKKIPTNGRLGLISENVCDCILDDYHLVPVITDEGFFDRNTDQYTFNKLSAIQDLKKVFDTFSNIRSKHIQTLLKEKRKIRIRFGIDSMGRLKAYDYDFKINKKLEQQLKSTAQYIVQAKSLTIPDKGGKNMIVNVDLVPTRTLVKSGLQKVDSTASKEEQIMTQQRNVNVITASNFGYINCDFFYRKSNLTNISIDIPSDKTDVKVFFKNYSAVMHGHNLGEKARVINIPKDEPVLIIGTLVRNNQLLMCLMEAKTGEPIAMKNFVPFEQEKIQAFLAFNNF